MSFMFDEPILYKNRAGDALLASLAAFEHATQGLGNNNRLMAMLKPGDRLVCASHEEAANFRLELEKRKIEGVSVVFGSPNTGEPLGTNNVHLCVKQPTYFTQSWYLAYYERELHLMEDRLAEIEDCVQGPRHEPEHVRKLA